MTTTTETTTALSETERWQVTEARALLAAWDRDRGGDGIYGTERTLADATRGLLGIMDHLAAELARQLQATRDVDDLRMREIGELRRLLSERDAIVIAALDEAAADREYRASTACTDCTYTGDGPCPDQREHAGRAAEYRAERDRLEAGR